MRVLAHPATALLLYCVLVECVPLSAQNQTACDVLVMGAGLSGTSAAWRLVGERPRGSPQPKVCLIEASDRIGGRTKDHRIEGCRGPQVVELGAQWIAQQDVDSDVWDLAVNVLGLGIYNGWPWSLYGFPYGPAEIDPQVKGWLDKVPSASSHEYNAGAMFFGPDPNTSDPTGQAPLACRQRVAKAYDSIVLGSPWLTPNASALDQVTPLEWMTKLGCNITREDLIAQGLNQVDIAKPRTLPPAFWVSMTSASSSGQEIFWEASALWWLHSVKSSDGPVSMTMDVQRYRIVGGPQQMSERLVIKLREAGAVVQLSSPVRQVQYSDDGVAFVTASGDTYTGQYAILTGNPVSLSTHLSWHPSLPDSSAKVLSSAHIGNYNKHYAFFTEGPIWRADPAMWQAITQRMVQWPMVYYSANESSQQMPNGTSFFPSAIIDNSPVTANTEDAGCPNGAGALFSFGWPQNGSTAAERADGWHSVLEGIPGLPAISSVVGQAWAEEPYIMGSYGAWWPPGVLSMAGKAWSGIPGGRVFFAGTEWSEVGSGYMNGAVHNGRKHGDMVTQLLNPHLFPAP